MNSASAFYRDALKRAEKSFEQSQEVCLTYRRFFVKLYRKGSHKISLGCKFGFSIFKSNKNCTNATVLLSC
jgi:hypothetical protein